jgi:p-methyltransferase
MAREVVDALFIPYYFDQDRWHNDAGGADEGEKAAAALRGSHSFARKARMAREGVTVDGKLYDLARLLSWMRYGSTVEYERYDSYSLTLLAGTYYLSFLRRHGVNVHVANSVSREALDSLGRTCEPRFVLLSTTLILENLIVREAIQRIRDTWPEAIVVLGGLFLVELQKTNTREKLHSILRSYGADAYVISPRAEYSLLDLLRLPSKQALVEADIPATYVLDGRTVREPSNLMDRDVEMAENYIRWGEHVPGDHLYHTVHTRTARSCAFVCAFCNFPVNQGPLTLMPVEVFERELQMLTDMGRVRSLIFTDDTFNVPQKRFKDLCRMMAKFDFEWYSFFRPQFADPETVELMKAAHCRGVFLGIESADDQILKNMNKAATVKAFMRGIRELEKHDIRMHANFIVGFPGETEQTARKLVDFLDDTSIEFFTLAPFYYVHSTPIHLRAQEFGLEGNFEKWKHNTMTSEQAFALTAELKRAPKYAVHAPELAANNFWTEIMFYANGWTVAESQLAFKLFNRFEGADVTSQEIQQAPEFAPVCQALHRHEMPRPKNY